MTVLGKTACSICFVMLVCTLFGIPPAAAQEENGLAATLEVLSAGVEVLRADTSNWIAINLESIVGNGDTIRTDMTGSARITYFADGTSTEVLPNSEYRIARFAGDDTSFTLILELVVGQTVQTLGRILDPSAQYDLITPAMTLSARGTGFTVRVLETGRTAMLVSEGTVAANGEDEQAEVPPAFGIRAEPSGELSDVVRASSFEELDAALDGCSASVTISDDVAYNVRITPDMGAEILAVIPPTEIDRIFGLTESTGWSLIAVDERRGWIRAVSVTIDENCAGLRIYSDTGEDLPLQSLSG